MRVTFIYTQEKTVIFYMLKLLLYEAGTKIWPICNLIWQLPIICIMLHTIDTPLAVLYVMADFVAV